MDYSLCKQDSICFTKFYWKIKEICQKASVQNRLSYQSQSKVDNTVNTKKTHDTTEILFEKY